MSHYVVHHHKKSNPHFLHFVAGFNLATQFMVLTFMLLPMIQDVSAAY